MWGFFDCGKIMAFKINKTVQLKRAKELRKNSTLAEQILWKRICRRQLGVKFRRQYKISAFIVDFYCHEHLLVIEVVGRIHDSEVNRKKLEKKLKILNEKGFKTMIVLNEELLASPEKVVEKILEALEMY